MNKQSPERIFFIILWILIYPTEAQLSGRIENVDIEWLVKITPFIVIATPINTPTVNNTNIAKSEHSYSWTFQNFEINEVIKENPAAKDKQGNVITVSNFDNYRYEIIKKYAKGFRKIGLYKTYQSDMQESVTENEKRILFLKEWVHKENKIQGSYVYRVEHAFDSIENLQAIKNTIKK